MTCFVLEKSPVEKRSGAKLKVKFEKMSKSKHNGVNPLHAIEEFSVDAIRLNVICSTDTNLDMKWDSKGWRLVFLF